jgi:pyruvate formate lyase activating enzyme
MTPGQIVEQALYYKSGSIAYTYSEPTVFYEYVYDTARLAKEKGLYNVYISAGYIEKEPLEALLPYLDVVKIDLKGFNDNFYKRIVDCRLSDILNTLKILKKHDKLVEIVNLVVPGLNDNIDEIRQMCRWIKREMGADTPLFFTRFMPQYLLTNLPATPVETLERAHDIAKEEGLNYVYVGNVPGHKYENTFCPHCGRVVVGRYGYTVTENNIKDGKCRFCGQKIPGIW